MKRYFVYVLRCADGAFYVGITNNLERRIAQHQDGWNSECFTHERRPVELVYSSDFPRVEDAIQWEKQIKGWSRAKKIALIRGDWERIKGLSRKHGPIRSPKQT